MTFYRIEPDVAGQIGENAIMDVTRDPHVVHRLHYEFEDWDGDVLVTSYPCYLITEAAAREVRAHQLSGADFAPVAISTTETFDELHPGEHLPPFLWLKITGQPCVDDFGLGPKAHLIASERALELLSRLGLPHAHIYPL